MDFYLYDILISLNFLYLLSCYNNHISVTLTLANQNANENT